MRTAAEIDRDGNIARVFHRVEGAAWTRERGAGCELCPSIIPVPENVKPPGRYGEVSVVYDEEFGGFLGFKFRPATAASPRSGTPTFRRCRGICASGSRRSRRRPSRRTARRVSRAPIGRARRATRGAPASIQRRGRATARGARSRRWSPPTGNRTRLRRHFRETASEHASDLRRIAWSSRKPGWWVWWDVLAISGRRRPMMAIASVPELIAQERAAGASDDEIARLLRDSGIKPPEGHYRWQRVAVREVVG